MKLVVKWIGSLLFVNLLCLLFSKIVEISKNRKLSSWEIQIRTKPSNAYPCIWMQFSKSDQWSVLSWAWQHSAQSHWNRALFLWMAGSPDDVLYYSPCCCLIPVAGVVSLWDYRWTSIQTRLPCQCRASCRNCGRILCQSPLDADSPSRSLPGIQPAF